MEKLIALKRYLRERKICNPEALHAYGERGTVEWVNSTAGADRLLYRHSYTGVIELHGAAGDIRDLLAHVLIWLKENGDDNDSLDDWSGEPLDERRSDMELTLSFEETVRYMPAEPGYAGKDQVTLGGVDYKREARTADVAETLAGIEVVSP